MNNFNPSIVAWNHLFIPRRQWCSHWCLRMDKLLHTTLYDAIRRHLASYHCYKWWTKPLPLSIYSQLCHQEKWNCNGNWSIFQGNGFENAVRIMSPILFQAKCVKYWTSHYKQKLIKQERRLKRRNTLGGLEISIRHQIPIHKRSFYPEFQQISKWWSFENSLRKVGHIELSRGLTPLVDLLPPVG